MKSLTKPLTAETLNIEGCKNLINGIYRQAAIDYIHALVSCNNQSIEQIGNFLTSGAYYKERGQGEYVKRKCLEEIRVSKNFVDNFLKSDEEKIKIDERKISIVVLKIVIRFCPENLKIKETKGIFYLIKNAI